MFIPRHNVSIAKLITYRIGGKADHFFAPKDLPELVEALQWCKGNQLPWFLLGFGSNILVSDEGFTGLVLKLDGDFNRVAFDDNNRVISVGAAAMLPKFARDCANRGISGFECLGDIPGTMGAAVRINAGTKEGDVKDLFISADILDEDGQIRTLMAENMDFGYRTSVLMQKRWVVLEARFKYGIVKDSDEIMSAIRTYRKIRKSRQPTNPRNCGSVFKSAEGRAAGWYIEQCELKGKRICGAMISPVHANWIVNTGNARATDIKSLIEMVQEKVKERFNVTLVREIEFIPEDF